MAPIQTHIVVQRLLALRLAFISAIGQPPVALEQDGRAQILLAVPPVAGAGGAAAGAEDALVEAVELPAVGRGLAVLFAIGGLGVALQVWLDGFVLLVEVSEVGDEVFDDVGVGEGIDAGLFSRVGWNAA